MKNYLLMKHSLILSFVAYSTGILHKNKSIIKPSKSINEIQLKKNIRKCHL